MTVAVLSTRGARIVCKVQYYKSQRDLPLAMLHRLPNGNVIMHDGLTRDQAIKRMEDHERWVQEHREELEIDSQQLFDDMFGG